MMPPYLKNQQSLPSLVGTPVSCSKFCTKSWKWLPQIKSFSLSTLGLNLSRIVTILCAVLQISQIYLTKRKRACVYPLCIALLQVWKWSGLYNFHSTKSLNNAASAQLVKHLPNYQFELDKSKLTSSGQPIHQQSLLGVYTMTLHDVIKQIKEKDLTL